MTYMKILFEEKFFIKIPAFAGMTLLFLSLVSCLFTPTVHASFTDEIGAEAEEIFEAAKVILTSKSGIKKIDSEKYELVSNWQYDEVERRRGVLRYFIKKLFKRRYRMYVNVGPGKSATELKIRAHVEEKSRATSPSIPWKKPPRLDRHDLRLERALFDEILEYLAKKKMKALSPEVSTS